MHQLTFKFPHQIKKIFPVRFPDLVREITQKFSSDFVTGGTDRRPDRRHEVSRFCPEGFPEALNRPNHDLLLGPPPTGMANPDRATPPVEEKNRYAICGADRKGQVALLRDQGVGLLILKRPRHSKDLRAVHLTNRANPIRIEVQVFKKSRKVLRGIKGPARKRGQGLR